MSGVSRVTGGMVSTGAHPTAGEIAAAVWDEDLTTHTTSKSAGWFVKKTKSIVASIMGMIQ